MSHLRLVAGLLVLAAYGCGGPLAVIPGGALSGSVQAPPDSWDAVGGIDTIQLETRPADPYSVNIWAAGLDDNLYVATGEDGTTWTGFIAEDPRVRVRIDGVVHELSAVPVTHPAERQAVLQAYADKYDVDPADSWVTTGMMFRLDRR